MAENRIDEQDVLNFALNLEYLEAQFYTYATTGKSITSFGVGIKGLATGANPTEGGATVGGKQVSFSDNELFTRDLVTQIGSGLTIGFQQRCERVPERMPADLLLDAQQLGH